MYFFAGLMAGIFIFGFLDYISGRKTKSIGRLVIDHSDIDEAHLFLEVDSGKSYLIYPGSKVSLDVVEKNYISQK